MADAKDDNFNEFTKITTVLAPFLLFLAVAAQLTGLWTDPITILITIGGICVAYVAEVLELGTQRFRRLIRVVRMLGSIFVGVGLTSAAISVIQTTAEVRGACTRYRAVLLQQPDSATADAYEALRCPVYSGGIWQSYGLTPVEGRGPT